jgi:hypothetical protein
VSAADLIATGVDVMADSVDDNDSRAWSELADLIREAGGGTDEVTPVGLREVVMMLRDAADGAREVHEGAPDVGPNTIARMRRFAAHMSAALKEIT